MATCTKAYSITVGTGLLFNWQAAFLFPSETGIATFFPGANQDGNTALGIAANGAGDTLSSQVIVTSNPIIWNSTAILPCNMHINLTPTITAGDTALEWGVRVDYGPLLVNEDQTTLGLMGSFDIPFSLPNTFGVDVQVSWVVQVQIVPNLNLNSGQMVVESIFSVL